MGSSVTHQATPYGYVAVQRQEAAAEASASSAPTTSAFSTTTNNAASTVSDDLSFGGTKTSPMRAPETKSDTPGQTEDGDPKGSDQQELATLQETYEYILENNIGREAFFTEHSQATDPRYVAPDSVRDLDACNTEAGAFTKGTLSTGTLKDGIVNFKGANTLLGVARDQAINGRDRMDLVAGYLNWLEADTDKIQLSKKYPGVDADGQGS
jgi:hypothetical protein